MDSIEDYKTRINELVDNIRGVSVGGAFRDEIVDYLADQQGFEVVQEQERKTILRGGDISIVVSETNVVGKSGVPPVVRVDFSTKKGTAPYQRTAVFGLPASI